MNRFYGTKVFFVIISILIASQNTKAQYFGKNKPIYKNFKFDVYQTPNFEIYYYLKNDSLLNTLALTAEKWYDRHYQVFRDSIEERNPIILYDNHADFQQTTAISGTIGIGTGGVTEALKNRVVFPITETWQQTNHVLGHELVHAFQYNSLINGDSTSLNSVRNLPLWMVEGMAEYLSLGTYDYQTAMWMRDAVLNDNFPTLQDMTYYPSKYFPYRWGHAFWSFVGRTFGDSLINPIFKETAKRGYNYALLKYIGLTEQSFSTLWKSVYYDYFKKSLPDSVDNPNGSLILFERNAGQINISPSVSPDGRYVAFYSEKDLFSIDLYLAHAISGKIVRRLSSVVHQNEIDALNFIESAGTWSPDSRMFAFVGYSKGKAKLIIADAYEGKLVDEFYIPGVPSFNYPAWSPDGKTIVVSGLVNGNNDLYSVDIKTKKVTQLTHDPWCNIHPAWSADGTRIVFSTDKPSSTSKNGSTGYNLATYDVNTNQITVFDIFPGADNVNPMFSADGKSIFFLSNSDGYRNLYRYYLETGDVYRMTRILTGISGMTTLAPAMSVARENDEIVYSHFYKSKYSIYTADTTDFNPVKVDPYKVDFSASILPPVNRATSGLVDKNLANSNLPTFLVDSFKRVPFKPKFKLDYISNIGMGVSSSPYGTGMAGGVEMLFSDITGKNMLYTGLSLNGEIYDFGGQVAFLQQKKYLTWGISASHIPYSFGQYGYDTLHRTIDGNQVVIEDIQLIYFRMFETATGLLMYFPLSSTQRFELNSSIARYYYRSDIYSNYYIDGFYYGSERRKGEVPPGFWLQQSSAAYVFDNSDFGIASPMRGFRMRLQGSKTLGEFNYWGALADVRKYFFKKPFSFAIRGLYYGRFGSSIDNNVLYPLYIGYPWYVRGYDSNAFLDYGQSNTNVSVDQLTGDNIVVTNFEIRIPFTGPERLCLIKSGSLFTELALFADAGIAWSKDYKPSLKWQPTSLDDRTPFVSTGLSLRINLFGMMILEPYYAIPFQLGGLESARFGINFWPGW
ncbi:basic secretory protein-like protein [Tenuifilum thalassicum]|uniref:TolB protein n=1 Tax=Tenuifilum thalassicum TaxID=2590900 RepID=A0A7D4BKF7_9BACT|nr:basic secretory protein-like protein [Tenuifilum thalassicum]QKG80179.1 tolB protein precursor [Tenuifilum thalassicum]